MSTASPRREVISIGVRSSLTFSINGNRFLRASLAVTAIGNSLIVVRLMVPLVGAVCASSSATTPDEPTGIYRISAPPDHPHNPGLGQLRRCLSGPSHPWHPLCAMPATRTQGHQLDQTAGGRAAHRGRLQNG